MAEILFSIPHFTSCLFFFLDDMFVTADFLTCHSKSTGGANHISDG